MSKIVNFLYFIKKIYYFTGKSLYINLVGMILVGMFEGLGILLLVPMLSSSEGVEIVKGESSFSNIFEVFPRHLSLTVILLIYVCLVVGQTLLQRSVTVRNVKIQIGFINSLRLEMYQSLLRSNWSFFIKKRKSDLVNALTTELGRVSMGANLSLQFLTLLIFTFIQVGLALWLSIKMTLFILICGGLIVFFSRKFIKNAKLLGNRTSEISKSYLGGITDHFDGIKDIKSNNLEEPQYNWLVKWSHKVEYEQIQYINLKMSSQFYYKVSLGIFIAIFIFLSIKVFHSQPEELLLIILIFARLWPRFINIQSNLEQIASTIPAFTKIITLQAECEEYKEIRSEGTNTVKSLPLNKEIECQNVFFRYNQSQSRYTLHNINLQIPAKSITVIIGHSGAGKSTLIDLLMGLIQPEKGQLLLDKVPLTNKNLLSFRKSISYVPQDPFLFNGSIKENLKLVVPNATEQEIWKALEFSSSADFVKKLPQGLDTMVGDRGVRLSGGERQRLVIARAILKKPSILVLDEATSALDNENDNKIQKTLDRLKENMTIILVTHRLSTICKANQVVLLKEGKIIKRDKFADVEEGREELLNEVKMFYSDI